MPHKHPRPGQEHARRLQETQKASQAAQGLPRRPEAPEGFLAFLMALAEKRILGPYRIGDRQTGHLLCVGVRREDAAWVCEQTAGSLKLLLLSMCKTPVQGGLDVTGFLTK